MAGLNIAIDAKINPALPSLFNVVDSDGSVIGYQHPNGKITFLPASDWDDNITAFAGGGQNNAVPLRYKNSRVATVATAADSVILPFGQEGMSIVVVNGAAANSMNVFPATGQAINALANDAALAVAANKHVVFSYTGTKWFTNLSA